MILQDTPNQKIQREKLRKEMVFSLVRMSPDIKWTRGLLALVFNIHRSTADEWGNELGLPKAKVYPTHEELIREAGPEIRRLHMEGLSTAEIATHLGLPQASVRVVKGHYGFKGTRRLVLPDKG
jgi:hypothetical protein